MTQKDANQLVWEFDRKGFKIVKGYSCYDKYGLGPSDLITLGKNSGKLGWNYTIFLHPESNTIFISGYRNFMRLGEDD